MTGSSTRYAMAWESVIEHPRADRTGKPRESGTTFVSVKGIGLGALRDMVEVAGPYIDRVKLAFASTVLYDVDFVRRVTALMRDHSIDVNPGGTCGEIALHQGRYAEFLLRARELGFSTIEVSDGTIPMDDKRRSQCIYAAIGAGFRVVSEVGSKVRSRQLGLPEVVRQIERDISFGVSTVIIESRATALGVGVFDEAGNIRDDYVDYITARTDPTSLTWEAPTPSAQIYFVSRFGPNVNIGNVGPTDVISLEAQRRGLRSDTLRLMLEGHPDASDTVEPTH
ncbi:MAG: phosphosulfolactate synthase [Chloroflexota bacterium]